MSTLMKLKMGVMKLLFFILILFWYGCDANESNDNNNVGTAFLSSTLSHHIINKYPHDTTLFTEGLFFSNTTLYESTGSPEELSQTKSSFGELDYKSGKFITKIELDRKLFFGEGSVVLNNRLYQLTYKSGVAFMYNFFNFKKLKTFLLPSDEGWGLTTDSINLIMSDGSSIIKYLNPDSFSVIKEVNVFDENGYVSNINELEYVQGYLYANIFLTNSILKIDPSTGKVIGKLDLTILTEDAKRTNPNSMEMNGIAYNTESNTFFITGKMWPFLYEIRIF